MSTKSYRPWAPDQPFLLPPSPRDWLPDNHLALFLLRVLESLDLSAIHGWYAAKDPRGERPYSPVMLVALLLYGYCTGVFSSRKIERATYEDVAFRVIAGGNHPDHVTIARFRKTFFDELAGLFVQVVQLCQKLGVIDLSVVALDGTRVLANASKHKAMSYDHMAKKRQRLQEEIEALLRHAEAVDAEEDALYGEDNGLLRQLPTELKRRQDQLDAIQAAMKALEQEAREARAEHLEGLAGFNDERSDNDELPRNQRRFAATRARRQREEAQRLRERDDADDDEPPSAAPGLPFGTGRADPEPESDAKVADLPEHKVKHTADARPHPRAQRNFTDPDSAIMEHKGGFVQAYNGQVVTTAQQFIVGQALTNQSADTHHLPPLMARVEQACTATPDKLLADTGFWAPENAAYCDDAGIDAYIAAGRESYGPATPTAGADPPQDPRERMRAKLRSDKGRDTYRARKWMVEPAIGQIKEAMGFRRFSVRGIDLTRAEWALVCACHNLLKLWRSHALTA